MKNVLNKKATPIVLFAIIFLIACALVVSITLYAKQIFADESEISDDGSNPDNFSYIIGEVSLTEDGVIIRNPAIDDLVLGTYTFYYATDFFGQNFYIADVTSVGDNYLDIGIANIRIFEKNATPDSYFLKYYVDLDFRNQYILEVQYYLQDENYLYSIYSEITESIVTFLTADATPINIAPGSKDPLAPLLNESINFDFRFKWKFPKTITQPQSARSMDISTNTLDNDGILKEYVSTYAGRVHFNNRANVATSDDSIIYIIPKMYFTNANTSAVKIGKEYGFYIRCSQANPNSVMSEVLVFDIDNVCPSPDINEGVVSVTPAFSARYYYDKTQKIVSLSTTGGFSTRLALANIKIDLGLTNAHHNGERVANYGDSDYNPYKDIGYCFGSYNFYTCGTAQEADANTFDATILKILLSKVKYVKNFSGPLLSIFETVDECQRDGFYKNQGFIISKDATITFGVNTLGTSNLLNHLDNFGVFPKGVNIGVANQSVNEGYQKIILYKTFSPKHEFKVMYNTQQIDDYVNIDAQLTSAVTLDIVEDNSNQVIFWNTGQVDYISTVTYAHSQEFNIRPDSNRPVVTMQENEIYKADLREGMFQDFKFTPYTGSNYTFETMGDDDVVLTLLNSNKAYIAENDNSGYATNARLSYNLTAGTTYFIRVKLYNKKFGSTKLFARREAPSACIQSNRLSIYNNSVYHDLEETKWRTFIPSTSGIYTFTIPTYDLVNMAIYNQKFNRIAIKQTTPFGFHSIIDIYLKANEEYHIATRIYDDWSIEDDGYGDLPLVIAKMDTLPFDIYGTSENFDFEAGGYLYYRIRLKTDGYYVIATNATSAYKDTYVTLLAPNFDFLASNDNNGSNLNCYLKYYLYADTTYYIRLRTNSLTQPCYGELFVYEW